MPDVKKAIVTTLTVLAVIFVARQLPLTSQVVDRALNG